MIYCEFWRLSYKPLLLGCPTGVQKTTPVSFLGTDWIPSQEVSLNFHLAQTLGTQVTPGVCSQWHLVLRTAPQIVSSLLTWDRTLFELIFLLLALLFFLCSLNNLVIPQVISKYLLCSKDCRKDGKLERQPLSSQSWWSERENTIANKAWRQKHTIHWKCIENINNRISTLKQGSPGLHSRWWMVGKQSQLYLHLQLLSITHISTWTLPPCRSAAALIFIGGNPTMLESSGNQPHPTLVPWKNCLSQNPSPVPKRPRWFRRKSTKLKQHPEPFRMLCCWHLLSKMAFSNLKVEFCGPQFSVMLKVNQ